MTTPLPPDPMHDDELPGEAELKALYRRLPSVEPAPELDASIRRAAARAVQDDRRPMRAPRRRHWPIALGTAATLVLVAGLAWHMREMPVPTASAPSAPVAAATIEVAHAGDAAVRADAGQTGARARVAPTMKAAVEAQRAAAEPLRPAAPRQAWHMAPPHPAMSLRMPAPAASPRPPERIAPASAGQAVPGVHTEARAPVAGAPEAAPMTALAPVAPAPPEPSPPPALPAPPAPPSAPSAFAPADASAPAAADMPATLSPAVELQAIRALYARGETHEADRRLRAFRDAHPDWPVPDDLQQHLEHPP